MEKVNFIYVILVSFMFSSCASILSPSNQEVTFKSDTYNMKLSIDSVYVGQGKELKYTLEKDIVPKQIIIDVEGYKKDYKVIYQDHRSNLYILSIIPFGILYYPMIYDFSPNTWGFDEVYTFNKLMKLPKWDSSKKRIFFKNVSFKVNKIDHAHKIYQPDDFFEKGKPLETKQQDSIYFKSSLFEDNLISLLKQTQFVDTSNTIFIDNINSLVFKCSVSKLTNNYIQRQYGYRPVQILFQNAELQTDWIIENVYGDTLLTESCEAQSGLFSIGHFKSQEAFFNSISDAINISWLNLIEKPKVIDLLKLDTAKNSFEKLTINVPKKTPTEIEEAMKATVTIKSDKGHGSGFVISNDGYIVTNYHVVNDKNKYKVITSDGKEFDANIVRINKTIDLALLKIEGEFEYAFKVPEDKNYKIGQNIFAIGTPRSVELGQSVSKGVISSVRKYKTYNYVQSDVSINRGNSGGPIVSEKGDLISVVEWKVGGFGTEGLSFSIPAVDIMKALVLSY